MLVQTRKQFEAARTILLDADVIALDTETSGLNISRDRLCGISTWCEVKGQEINGQKVEVGYYFPFRHKPGQTLFDNSENIPEAWLSELIPAFERDNATFIFHNSKYDMAMLRHEMVKICGYVYDTQLLSHMNDENESHKLEDLAGKYVEKKALTYKKEMQAMVRRLGSYPSVPPATMEVYAVKDAHYTWQLKDIMWDKLEKQDMQKLWPDVEKFIKMLHEMEWYGIRRNPELAQALSVKTVERMRQIEDELGFDPLKLNTLAKKLFLAPPDGLGFISQGLTKEIMPEFPNGRPVMDEKTLSNYRHPTVDLVLEYRGHVKANSTWYEGFLIGADDNGRIHPTYNIGGTKTSRLSCSKPNLQQLPRNVEDTPVRRLLIPPDDYELWEFDYSQIEFRLASVYAKEDRMLQAFRDGADVYQTTADVLGLTRFQAKTLNLGTVYGIGIEKLADTFEVSLEQAQSILNSFHSEYPGYRMTAKAAEEAAGVKGWVKLWTGRRRHFDEAWEHHKAFNSICQGGAAEIVKKTMLMFYDEPDPNYRPVLQVHDSLLFEIKAEHRDAMIAIIKNMMEWPGRFFPCPFTVEVKRWDKSVSLP